MLTVDVAVMCSVKGCALEMVYAGWGTNTGLGRARICDKKFVSRKSACS